MTGGTGPVLRVTGLTGGFGGQSGPTLHDVTFDVQPNRITAVVGETGSGKSLTALAALRIAPRSFQVLGGTIEFDGMDLLTVSEARLRTVRGRRIGMVFQDARTALNPVFTVGQQIADVVRVHFGVSRKAARERTLEVLDRVRIRDPERRAGQYPHQFSGGMAQRAMIAMALVCEPELMILDEPTTGLDVTIQAGIMDLILDLADSGMTALLITHDLGVVAETCEDVVVMRHGKVVETATAKELFTAAKHPYTQQLLAASRAVEGVVS
ncbi:MAG: ABC transporter ATP-binding protein [Candidatus Nanopelagicales bacterium]